MDELRHSNIIASGRINNSTVRQCLEKGDSKLALEYCNIMLAKNPQNTQVLLFAALASMSLGWLNKAKSCLNLVTQIAPNQPAAFSLLGDILLKEKNPELALKVLLRANQLGDATAQIYFNIGSALLALESFERAITYLDKALAIDELMIEAYVNKGLAEHSLMELDSAIFYFNAALGLDPGNVDALWNKSHVMLTSGQYKEGFSLYETRWRNSQVKLRKRSFDSPLWLGNENLVGKKILLYAEGGFGDTLQFIRYAKIFDQGIKLIIQCQLPLLELIREMGIEGDVITLGETPPAHDFHCPLMSLPLAFGTTIDTVPLFDHYVYAPKRFIKKWDGFFGHLPRPWIGIAARGGNSFSNDQNRSMDLETTISHLPQTASYVILQKDISETEASFIDSALNIVAPRERLESFADTAAICNQLDAIVSVDTSVAHLAAAMGKPTTILLAYRPDWRWGCFSDRTSWYPTARLLRQKKYGDWTSVLSELSKLF